MNLQNTVQEEAFYNKWELEAQMGSRSRTDRKNMAALSWEGDSDWMERDGRIF